MNRDMNNASNLGMISILRYFEAILVNRISYSFNMPIFTYYLFTDCNVRENVETANKYKLKIKCKKQKEVKNFH